MEEVGGDVEKGVTGAQTDDDGAAQVVVKSEAVADRRLLLAKRSVPPPMTAYQYQSSSLIRIHPLYQQTRNHHQNRWGKMSSRALRRAQKELEERQRLEELAQSDEEDELEEVTSAPAPKPSLFAMLGDAGDDEEEAQADESGAEAPEEADTVAPASKPSKKTKKKKKKGKGKAKANEPEKTSSSSKIISDMDEIDRALLALNLTSQASSSHGSDQLTSAISEEMQQLYAVLSVDTQHLQAANEMRKLFGRAAVQSGDDEGGRARQRGRGQQGIAAAVAGRNAPGSRNLASLGLRRNIFIQGKEEWPRATSGGLGMEIVEKRSDGSVEYRFVHNRTYQEIQEQFETCVASMDPERMIQLLHFNRMSHQTRLPT